MEKPSGLHSKSYAKHRNCSTRVFRSATATAQVATRHRNAFPEIRLFFGLKRSQVPGMMEILSITGRSGRAGRASSCRLTAREAGWLRDDWPDQVPIALPSMTQAACRCRIAGARSIVGR